MRTSIFVLVLSVLLVGCGVSVNTPLSTSLGMDAFSSMRRIDIRNTSLALKIDPELLNATIKQKIRDGDYSFEVGKAFAAKFIKGLAYNFKTIEIVDQSVPSGTPGFDAELRITLQDMDATLNVRSGFTNVHAEGYTRLSVKAEMRDIAEDRIIWVGTTQVSEEAQHSEYARMSYQEAGRGFAEGIDRAIDKAVGDLLKQINKSQSLEQAFHKWEEAKGGNH